VVAKRGASDVLVVLCGVGALEGRGEGAVGEAHQAGGCAVAFPVCFGDERDCLVGDVDAADGYVGVAEGAGQEFAVAWREVVSRCASMGRRSEEVC